MKAVWSMATMRIRPSSRSSRCILRFILRSPSISSRTSCGWWSRHLDDDSVGARLDGVLERGTDLLERVADVDERREVHEPVADEPGRGVEVLLVAGDDAEHARLAVVHLVRGEGEGGLGMGGREEDEPASIAEHRHALLVRLLVADRGDHRFRAATLGELLDPGDRVDLRGIDELGRPQPGGHREASGIDLADDDAAAVLAGRDEVD